jgi:hypothetical protein
MVRNTRRHSNSFQSQIKDYFVPIIGAFLLIVVVYSFFNNSETQTPVETNENRTPTSLSLWSVDTEAYIVYPSDEKEKINESSLFYKGEKIIVTTWSIKLLAPDTTSIHLNKIWELEYKEDGSYNLYSSEAWFDIKSDTKISLQYASVESPKGSVLSLTQNEAASIIYVLSGSAKVTNLGWVSTSLVKWQKISISRLNAASKDIDLSAEKWNIDSYFKGTDWFIDNQGHLVLQKEDETPTDTGSWEMESSETQTGGLISFINFRDEMSVDSSTISISWNILDSSIEIITFNNKQASLNTSSNTFKIDGITLPNSMNDIVVKIYDTERNILDKEVYTVYTSRVGNTPVSPQEETQESTPRTNIATPASRNNINPADFGFTEPSANGNFTTTGGEITIRGFTKAANIDAVQVNGFPLSSFNGSTWRYHAFERFETLKTGTNQYKIDYLDASWNIIYSDFYTIVKKENANSTTSSSSIVSPTSSSGWASSSSEESEIVPE